MRAAAGPAACFEVTAGQNSPGTRKVFTARHCQGGGVTWGPLLAVLAARQGHVEDLDDLPPPGWTGSVSRLNGATLFSIDDEGDDAQFCAATPELVATIRREVARLNEDTTALTRAMGAASALAMECLEADGTTPSCPRSSRRLSCRRRTGPRPTRRWRRSARCSPASRSGASRPTTKSSILAPSASRPTEA